MAKVKTKRAWRPGKLQRRVGEIALQMAETEAERIP